MENYRVFNADGKPAAVIRGSDGASIGLADDNLQCRQFLVDAKAGATVENADGTAWAYSASAVRALGLEPI